MYDICLKYCYSKLLHLQTGSTWQTLSAFFFAGFSMKKKSQVDMHYIVSRAIVSDTLVGHNLGENAHKSSFLRGWDVMKDKI